MINVLLEKRKMQTSHHDNKACFIFKLISYHFSSYLFCCNQSGLLSIPPLSISSLWSIAKAVPSAWDILPHTSCLADSSYPSVLGFISFLREVLPGHYIKVGFPCHSLSRHSVHLPQLVIIYLFAHLVVWCLSVTLDYYF